MRFWIRILPPVLIIASGLGCGETRTLPTAPLQATPAPPPDLNGTWSGTFSEREGSVEPIQATIRHVRDSVQVRFSTRGGWYWEFPGRLEGCCGTFTRTPPTLAGVLWVNEQSMGNFCGPASATEITLYKGSCKVTKKVVSIKLTR